MKKSASNYPANLPISKKAYLGFVARIEAIFKSDKATSALMRDALDCYLSGDTDAIDFLPSSLRHAFAFLCQEVDCAINRSARARERAALRKPKSTATETAPTVAAPLPVADTVTQPEVPFQESATPSVRPLTRQQRRAREREARKNAMQTHS